MTPAGTRERLIVHVAQVAVEPSSGMGRVAWHWRRAFEARGYRFLHLGPELLPASAHPARFPLAAWRAVRSLPEEPAALLLHEPAAFPALTRETPAVVFSHGLERRAWEVAQRSAAAQGERPPARSRLLYPVWRLLACDVALRRCRMLLVLNSQDRDYAEAHYRRAPGTTRIVRNGVDPTDLTEEDEPEGPPTVAFVGSYLARKGVATLQAAARILAGRGREIRWLLAGTGLPEAAVLRSWPAELHGRTEVLPSFRPEEEAALLGRATLFVLPSLFEGQPLALLQAMAAGRCCIATDTCGQRDLIRPGTDGLLVAPGDAEALAGAIARALDDPGLRRRLGAAARKAVAGRTWERVSHEVVDLVEEHLDSRSRRAEGRP